MRLHELTALRAQPWRYTVEMQFGELANARVKCARLIGADPREIALMVNTSYGLNLAARALPFERGRHRDHERSRVSVQRVPVDGARGRSRREARANTVRGRPA